MKKTHDNFKRSRKRMIIGACVLLALSIFITVPYISFGAYNQSLSAQRTVAAYEKEEVRFSSNYLEQILKTRAVYVPNAQTAPTCLITVCNYPQGKPNKPSATAISYTLTARFVQSDGTVVENGAYVGAHTATIRKGSGADLTLSSTNLSVSVTDSQLTPPTLAGTLTANEAASDLFTLTFGAGFVGDNRPDLCVEVVATPTTAGISEIKAVFKPELRTEGASNAWTGAFGDDTSKAPAAYDGFNYTISGTGRGTATLTWNGTKVTLSYVSQNQLLAITGASQTGNSITFPVDSDTEGHYDLQFYKVNITTETWSDMGTSVVTFGFHS